MPDREMFTINESVIRPLVALLINIPVPDPPFRTVQFLMMKYNVVFRMRTTSEDPTASTSRSAMIYGETAVPFPGHPSAAAVALKSVSLSIRIGPDGESSLAGLPLSCDTISDEAGRPRSTAARKRTIRRTEYRKLFTAFPSRNYHSDGIGVILNIPRKEQTSSTDPKEFHPNRYN